MAIAEVGEFKGKKVIILKRKEQDEFPFQFGVKKALLVLEHIEDIRKFVTENRSH